MSTALHWLNVSLPGKLALAARPRGGDWLEDEAVAWQRAGISAVVSLLTPEEVHELELENESRAAKAAGMNFISFPIEDRQVPASEVDLSRLLEELDRYLKSGKNVVVHCRQGIGRTGLVAACLLVTQGVGPIEAVSRLSAARGLPIPETEEQRQWIDDFALTAIASK